VLTWCAAGGSRRTTFDVFLAKRSGTDSAFRRSMPPTPSAERPLIDDAQFFAELERFAHVDDRSVDPSLDADMKTFAEAFDALESGLPVHPGAVAIAAPHYQRPPIDAASEAKAPAVPPAAPETRVTFTIAAVVLAGCLTFGAATAAYVFQDRVEQITAPRTATR
jgi:hypothetical protein